MQTSYYYSYRRYRPGKKNKSLVMISLLLAAIVLLVVVGNIILHISAAMSGYNWVSNSLLLGNDRDSRGIFRVAAPIMAWADGGENIPQVVSPDELIKPLVHMFLLDSRQPLHLLESQVPLLAAASPPLAETVPVLAPEIGPAPDEELENAVAPLSEECLVAIYNTHTGETYALTDGMERLDGKQGGVVKVSKALGEELEIRHGIRVAVSDVINDANYNTSYSKSQETLHQLLEDNPSVQVVLDIHRDAGKARENSLVTVDGQQVAPVLIVIGSDARTPFPTWRQNYDFGKDLSDEINKQHPGLCLGVLIKEGRYNQFLHQRAVLLEVGSVSNSTEEAVQTARLLAGPVAEIVKRYLDTD